MRTKQARRLGFFIGGGGKGKRENFGGEGGMLNVISSVFPSSFRLSWIFFFFKSSPLFENNITPFANLQFMAFPNLTTSTFSLLKISPTVAVNITVDDNSLDNSKKRSLKLEIERMFIWEYFKYHYTVKQGGTEIVNDMSDLRNEFVNRNINSTPDEHILSNYSNPAEHNPSGWLPSYMVASLRCFC